MYMSKHTNPECPRVRHLNSSCRYFHAYRIDHVLGFFRIWEIPGDCTSGLLGHFRPSIPIDRHELESHGIWDIDRWGSGPRVLGSGCTAEVRVQAEAHSRQLGWAGDQGGCRA